MSEHQPREMEAREAGIETGIEGEAELFHDLRALFGELKFSTFDALQQAATQEPDGAAFLDIDRESMSYARLLAQARDTVATLNGLGYTRSSRIALVLPTNSAAASVHLCVVAGMGIMPLNATSPADEYERNLRQGGADALLVEQGQVAEARTAAARLGLPIIEIAFRVDGPVGQFEIVGQTPDPARQPHFAQPEDVGVVILTSGTTDLPKLVPFTQRQLLIRAYCRSAMFLEDPCPRVSLVPFNLNGGWVGILRAIVGPRHLASIPNADPVTAYRYLAYYRPPSLVVAPAMLQALIDEAPRHHEQIAQLRFKTISVTSAAVAESLLRQAQRIFRCPIQVMYGSSEAGIMTELDLSADDTSYRMGMVGKPLRYVKVKIADEAGASLPAGELGEVAIRSPMTFNGYENNAEANANAFRDGWLYTGDVGYVDEAGGLFLAGRRKEIINRGGSKVSPVEVDHVLLEHPSVAQAATFAIPHAVLGEDLAAAIVLTEPGLTARELRNFAAERLARYKVPSRFVFVNEIPRTDSGKIMRSVLTKRFVEELGRSKNGE